MTISFTDVIIRWAGNPHVFNSCKTQWWVFTVPYMIYCDIALYYCVMGIVKILWFRGAFDIRF